MGNTTEANDMPQREERKVLVTSYDEACFISEFNKLSVDIHDQCKYMGFWDMGVENRNAGEALMLMVSELSEGFEGLRKGGRPDDHLPEFMNHEVEMADCIIRIMDWCKAHNWRVAEAIVAKHHYNAGRPYKHGKHF